MSVGRVRVKRFYKDVSVAPNDGGYGLYFNGKPAKTKSGALLAAPTSALANVIAEEWNRQGEYIIPETMPFNAYLNASIESDAAGDLDEILNYLGSDLLCYRAEEPKALLDLQLVAWNPYLAWFENEFGIALSVTAGIISVDQPEAAIGTVRRDLGVQPLQIVFAIKTATAISGSAVLALALWKGVKPAPEIFDVSRMDEHFQEEKWGADEEAKTREAQMRQDFLHIAEFMELSVAP